MYVIKGLLTTACEGWEEIDEAETLKEAKSLLTEYKTAFGDGWIFTIKRARNV